MSDLYEPAAVRGRGERTAVASGDARELRGKTGMGIVLWAFVGAIGAVALAGSGRAGSEAPGGTAAVSEAAASAPRCPAGWRWQPGEYNRWSVWHPGHCNFGRG